MSEVYLTNADQIKWLRGQQQAARAMYEAHKDKYNVDGGTPEDTSDDIH